jgi:hypothetical protein
MELHAPALALQPPYVAFAALCQATALVAGTDAGDFGTYSCHYW